MLNLYSSSQDGRLFTGVAGWAYPHWHSLLEVENPQHPLTVLARLCEFFSLLEITSAYYHPPEARTVKAWLAETPNDRPFFFTIRLWNKLVRERALLLQNDIRLMKAALSPLQEAGKLGALLVPVLSTMRYSESNELWLLGLLDAFAEFPLFVENLHPSWAKSDTILRLQDRGIGIVALDEADAKQREPWSKPSAQGVAYLRCAGRESNAVSAASGERDAHLEYLYSEAEIASLALKVKMRLPHLSACFVVFSNHPRGYSLANALQLQSAVTGARLNPPRSLVQAFPVLQKFSPATLQQRDLFEESI